MLSGFDMKKAIVLVSGGMDSLVTAAIAATREDKLYFLHFSYGQRTETKERWCFEELSRYYNAKAAKVIDYRWLAEIGGSSLLIEGAPIKSLKDGIPDSYVPFRNATMLCAAISWAEVIEAQHIYIGAVEEDSSGYPDTREVFFNAMNQVIKYGSVNNQITIETPVLHKTKKEIVELGLSLNAPFDLSWSCYISADEACGKCPSCLLRLRAFQEARHKDPIPYLEQ